jgi:hypothetical protein
MGAVSNMYNLPQAAEKALRAGNHMFLICKPEGVVEAFRKLLRTARRDTKLAKAIYQNSSRILASKMKQDLREMSGFNLRKEIKALTHFSKRATENAITKLAGSTPKALPDRLTLFYPLTLKYGQYSSLPELGCEIVAQPYSHDLSGSEARRLVQRSRTDWNAVVSLNRGNHYGQKELITLLIRRGKKVALFEAGFPDPSFPAEIDLALATYCSSPAAITAALLVWAGKRKATGRLPLQTLASLVS